MILHKALLTACVMCAAGSALADAPFVVLQSTTSTQNSGLYDAILPEFTAQTGIDVRVVAVGTGQAIKNASNCDGDVLLVHSKADEDAFVDAGFGQARFDVMYNDFVLIGPEDDPAGAQKAADVTAALNAIHANASVFASRGDDSGTHKKEMVLWGAAGIDAAADSGTWYRETGSGMGATLNIAIGMNGYVISDRATWLAFENRRNHRVVFEGDPALFNQYGVILVSPEHCPKSKQIEGQAFVDWILGDGQAAIGSYTRDGEQLFFPNAQ